MAGSSRAGAISELGNRLKVPFSFLQENFAPAKDLFKSRRLRSAHVVPFLWLLLLSRRLPRRPGPRRYERAEAAEQLARPARHESRGTGPASGRNQAGPR